MGRRRVQGGAAGRVRRFSYLHLVEVGLQAHALGLLQVHPLLVESAGGGGGEEELRNCQTHAQAL